MLPGDAISDEALPDVIASNLASYAHPTSTVPMGGPRDPWAVVDEVGAVKGLAGLRVVDASILPEIPVLRHEPHHDHGRRARSYQRDVYADAAAEVTESRGHSAPRLSPAR